MKLKYTNFKRQSDDMPDVTYVPKELIRKHWSIQTIELCFVSIGLASLILLVQTINNGNIIGIAGALLLAILIWVPAVLSILDNPGFKWAYPASTVTLTLIALICLPLKISIWILLFGLLVNIVIALLPKNRSYFEWCKSISSDNK